MLDMALNGLSLGDLGLAANRMLLGVFFLLARFRWVWDPSRPEDPWFNLARKKSLVDKLCHCGYGWHPPLAAAVALVEILAGAALIVGLCTVPAAFGLLVILLFATWCTAYDKVMEQKPVDAVDMAACYLWRVEGPYIFSALGVLMAGPGGYSLDHILWRLYG